MKIGFLITRSDQIGGAHVHVRDLSQALSRDHEVLVLVGGEGPFTEQLRERGVAYKSLTHLVRAIRPAEDLRATYELAHAIRSFRPDLLSTHSAKAGWIGRVVGRAMGVPTLFTAHGWAFSDGKPAVQRHVYAGIERLTATLANKIITVSDYDRMLAIRHRVGTVSKIVTVHNGVHDAPGRAIPSRDRLEPLRIIAVARFEEPKDHPTLIRALATLRDKSWQLTILGDGPLMPASEALAEELGIRSRIDFLGLRKDVAEQLAKSHAFVLITKWEGFPRSILEAMRSALPVVASNVGGISESVSDGQTGFLVAAGDHEHLARSLAQLIDHPELGASMGAAGRVRYEQHFTFSRLLRDTLGVYEGVLRSRVDSRPN